MSRERRAGARWQEIIHLVDSRGPWAERGKQEASGRQRKVGKGGNILCPNVTHRSSCSHRNKISLTDNKYPSGANAMRLLISVV